MRRWICATLVLSGCVMLNMLVFTRFSRVCAIWPCGPLSDFPSNFWKSSEKRSFCGAKRFLVSDCEKKTVVSAEWAMWILSNFGKRLKAFFLRNLADFANIRQNLLLSAEREKLIRSPHFSPKPFRNFCKKLAEIDCSARRNVSWADKGPAKNMSW